MPPGLRSDQEIIFNDQHDPGQSYQGGERWEISCVKAGEKLYEAAQEVVGEMGMNYSIDELEKAIKDYEEAR